jgi:pre-mRNA-splicing factor SYF1
MVGNFRAYNFIVAINYLSSSYRLDYCELLVKLSRGTTARRTFDRALQALPITQHKKIWDLYIKWAKGFGVGETCVRVYRRYLMYDSSSREDFVQYLLDVGQHEEAARQLSICVSDDHFISSSGKTRHQLWMQLCDLCAEYPQAVSRSLKVDAIIRSGIVRFSDEVGHLWCRLADFYVRMGQFEKARDVYEEALNSVTTVRDFSVVFDSYVKVEESILSAKMSLMETENAGADDDDAAEIAEEVEMRLARLEFLMDQRPLLLSSVVLRQNPHNVFEWHKRAKLFVDDPQRTLMTYIEGIKTVDPKIASGKLSGLWLALARFYESHKDVDNARTILSKATMVDFKGSEELPNVYCAWGEFELRHEEYDRALSVMQQAVAEPVSSVKRRKAAAAAQGRGVDTEKLEGASAADRVYKSVRAWNFYLDLEENLGTIETCRAAYERAFDLKVITPQMALNYAAFLEERNFFEDSFRVYERAVALFIFPQVKAIWLQYLDKFISRYGGTKLERLRDLFEQSVSKVPEEDAAEFFVKYAKAEEQFGLARHALAVYDRATRLVPETSRLDMYRLYIKKVEQFYGVTKTRPVYERAISELNDVQSRSLCVEFANVERKLGEIDRARAILQHGAQFADPRKDPGYWRQWREFEEAHGNEDTFREMLRVQRSVETAYSQVKTLAVSISSCHHPDYHPDTTLTITIS